jgi:hypothetical protein
MLGLNRDEISGGEDDSGSSGGPTDGGVVEKPSDAVLYTLGDESVWVSRFHLL